MKITEKLIRDLVEAEYTLQGYYDDAPLRPVPGPPASDKELADFESALHSQKLPLPPSYRAFLAVCNGLEHFEPNLSLVRIETVLTPPSASLRRRYPALSRFMIGRGNTLAFIAFDPDTARDGEMEVVWVADDGNEARYPNFAQFMHLQLKRLLEAIDDEQADRKGLKD